LSMYSIAIAAYVGGGFGAGVHSVAEAAGYGIPIACGSNISRNQSAIELLNLGGLSICTNENEFYSWITQVVLQLDKQQSIGLLNKSYVLNGTGTASKLVDMILKK